MAIIYFILNALAAVVLLLIGSVVLVKNPTEKVNRVFSLFSLLLAVWIASNYLSNLQTISYNKALLLNHIVLCVASLSLYIFLLFVYITSPPLTKLMQKITKYIIYFGCITALFSLTPYVVESITKQKEVYAVNFGNLAFVYFFGVILAVVTVIVLLAFGLVRAKGLERNRLNIILWSIVGTVIIALLTNLFIPIITGSFELTNIGPLSTLILASGLAYSIVKHRLFDIRLVIARSFAYILSIVVVVSLFTALAFGISSLVLANNISIKQEVFFAIFSAITALAFQPIKKFFDKATNKIFYKDAYDSQLFMDNVNSTLVGEIDLHNLLDKTSRVIKDNLKVDHCNFYIDEKESLDFHVVGTDITIFGKPEWTKIYETISKSDQKIFGHDHENDQDLGNLIHNLGVEAIVKLASQDQNVGYIIVGQKKSGSAFISQDYQILEIIADEVAITVQNSLRFVEIAQFNITLQKRIEDATAQLQKTNEKLVALDEAKDEFISMASHQLRTPLTSIKGYLSMLQEGDAGELNDQQHNFVDQAFLSSQRMVYLIADLLNVSRLKTGKFVIEAKPTYLPDVVEGELNQLTETVKARNLEMVYDKPTEFPVMNLDETKVRQVIMNFADNAIYYTPSGGKITVKLEADDNNVTYTVTDTGIGVPKSEQHHLFTKFYRAGNARKARPDGTGLGLFMAKKVVVAQGGSIIFKTQEGKGSTFGFSFPRAKLELKDSPAPQTEEKALV